ncbi:hypothetical protein Xgly_16485 [Xanthomonas citri pv. glycines]|nr:hypothetical protein A9D66_09925 [Xanthomonas citri pv. glycines str. 12-2]OOX02163.1 hypothetical protein Xgly_16485 [Xanthomonas citri pv. glycines]
MRQHFGIWPAQKSLDWKGAQQVGRGDCQAQSGCARSKSAWRVRQRQARVSTRLTAVKPDILVA